MQFGIPRRVTGGEGPAERSFASTAGPKSFCRKFPLTGKKGRCRHECFSTDAKIANALGEKGKRATCPYCRQFGNNPIFEFRPGGRSSSIEGTALKGQTE